MGRVGDGGEKRSPPPERFRQILFSGREILRLSERDGVFCTIIARARIFSRPMAVKFTSP